MRSKKSGREFAEELLAFLRAGDGLIEGEVDLIGRVDRRCFLSTAVGRSTTLPSSRSMVLELGAELGHRLPEGPEVVDHGLVDQDVAIGEEEDAFLAPGLPQAPDDLKGGVGLAGAGCHDEEDAILALGDGFDGLVDRDALVVARLLAAGVVVVVLEDDVSPARAPSPFHARYLCQSFSGDGKSVERQLLIPSVAL